MALGSTSRRSRRRGVSVAAAASAALLAFSGCTELAEEPDERPEVTTLPMSDLDMSEILATESDVDQGLVACDILGLTVADVSAITGIELDEEHEIGRADVPNQCAYGVPPIEDEDDDNGEETAEDANGGENGDANGDEDDGENGQADDDEENGTEDEEVAAAGPGAGTDDEDENGAADDDTTPTTTARRNLPSPDGPSAHRAASTAPSVVSAGVVIPHGDLQTAFDLQADQLAPSYECSELHPAGDVMPPRPDFSGPDAAEEGDLDGEEGLEEGLEDEATEWMMTESGIEITEVEAAPYSYYACTRPVAGGGTQAEVILLTGDALWHLSASLPAVERTSQSIDDAVASLLHLSVFLPETVLV